MREWLSGGAPPCQGGGRGFDPRLALEGGFRICTWRQVRGFLFFVRALYYSWIKTGENARPGCPPLFFSVSILFLLFFAIFLLFLSFCIRRFADQQIDGAFCGKIQVDAELLTLFQLQLGSPFPAGG